MRREIKAHVPEQFWRIVLKHQEANKPATEFTWARGRLFDHAIATLLYELCLDAGEALVTKVRAQNSATFPPLRPNHPPCRKANITAAAAILAS